MMRSNKFLLVLRANYIIAFIFFVTVFMGCNEETDNRIIYEVSPADQLKLQKIIKSFDFDKVIVSIEMHPGLLYLCFRNAEDKRLKEFYTKTNRYLKISDDIFIPVYFSQDLALTKSDNTLRGTGCVYKYDINRED